MAGGALGPLPRHSISDFFGHHPCRIAALEAERDQLAAAAAAGPAAAEEQAAAAAAAAAATAAAVAAAAAAQEALVERERVRWDSRNPLPG